MATFEDSITIRCSASDILALLSDLERHAAFVPEGFKRYRILSRQTAGRGARAALELNLLGHWLPGELEILEADTGKVEARILLDPVELRLHFRLIDRGLRTEVHLHVDHSLRRLAPWRVRTRIKQRLRLTQDIRVLHSRFLSVLKEYAERSAGEEEQGASSGKGEATAKDKGVDKDKGAEEKKEALTSKPVPEGGSTAGKDEVAGREGKIAFESSSADREPASSKAPANLGPGQARIMKVNGREVAVFNVEGSLYAIDNACPHRGGSLGFGVVEGSIVTCPLHGWTFDVKSGRCTLIEGVRVSTYPVEIVDGQVKIGEASSSP